MEKKIKIDPSLRGTNEFNEQLRKFREDLYKDKDGNSISLDQYCSLLKDESYKIIAQEHVNELWVSTVWLGVRHWGGNFFETMVFKGVNNDLSGDWKEQSMYRYQTKEEAIKGHCEIVKNLKTEK